MSRSPICQHTRVLYTMQGLADSIGVSISTVRNWIDSGKLPDRRGADGIRGAFWSQKEIEIFTANLFDEAEAKMAEEAGVKSPRVKKVRKAA